MCLCVAQQLDRLMEKDQQLTTNIKALQDKADEMLECVEVSQHLHIHVFLFGFSVSSCQSY